MCGRFALWYQKETTDPCLDEHTQLLLQQRANGETFPGMDILCYVREDDRIISKLFTWGFTMGKRKVIKARLETSSKRLLFAPAVHHRCVVLANAYYEWKRVDDEKVRFQITFRDKKRMYMAALRNEQNEVSILTMTAKGKVAAIHDRMPIILDEMNMAAYLRNERAVLSYHHLDIAREEESR